ncbi:hypothetical protein MCOR27_000583 [Pyricularia oryzae]|uniref:Uncharacterized protein n=1 Tax=Pyricularia grisea TaxID=148305 RepID=A0ABQ8NKP4_PYRGI|nr:hypothetical protein MCOR01_005541 [Pyricularia oryzae]KAI6298500.1 hypothetical protein MCOR33_005392 [Pyricularia grisea]KAI6251713.1 hypothetical protein MCOR19_011654 [Pyricularia oryzae]KAI6280363.1 hypothetical protein MCOR26_003781 [Pyricularia oryzae]KAI6289012.1 hypothetical protein MCOR27_000583 [Pyricularia oryzae]
MCTSYYVHYHHLPTCSRPIDIALEYTSCPAATEATTSTTSSPTQRQQGATATHDNQDGQQRRQQRQPCEDLHHDPWASVDLADPCMAGGCFAVSPECGSGLCRLNDLGGRWACCSCGRGGNTYRWCRHKMKKSPDTFCYHTCCENCTADPVGGGGGDSEGSGGRE